MFMCFRSTSEALDISGFGAIPETPRRPPTAAPASLHVLRRPPLDGEYISVTDSSGSRVYLRQKEDTGTKVSNSSSVMLKPCFIHSTQTSSVMCLFLLYICIFCINLCVWLCVYVCVCLSLQVVESRFVPNSHGGLGLLALPIGVLREHEAEKVRDQGCCC